MAEFFLAGRFECRDFQRRRIQLSKHLFDEAVLARRVTRLNGNQDALAPLRIEFILQCRRFRKVLQCLRLERLLSTNSGAPVSASFNSSFLLPSQR